MHFEAELINHITDLNSLKPCNPPTFIFTSAFLGPAQFLQPSIRNRRIFVIFLLVSYLFCMLPIFLPVFSSRH